MCPLMVLQRSSSEIPLSVSSNPMVSQSRTGRSLPSTDLIFQKRNCGTKSNIIEKWGCISSALFELYHQSIVSFVLCSDKRQTQIYKEWNRTALSVIQLYTVYLSTIIAKIGPRSQKHTCIRSKSHNPPADPLRPWFFLMQWTNFGISWVINDVDKFHRNCVCSFKEDSKYQFCGVNLSLSSPTVDPLNECRFWCGW